jgi:hypothetical protein
VLTTTTVQGKRCFAALLALVLAGCFAKEEPAMSVPEYLLNPSQMSIDAGWCSANPGERGGLAKCVNALEAKKLKEHHEFNCREFKKC